MLLLTLTLLACRPLSDTGDSAPAAEPPPGWVAPDARGPYEAGVETFEYTDPRGKEMVIEVWYPALPDEGDEPAPYPLLPITREAYREAPADTRGAPYPLIAFSHGYSGIRYQSIFLTEVLAQHGFVVVAPDHPNNTLFDVDDSMVGEVMAERPDDVRYAVDELLALATGGHERLGGMVDPAAGYGVMGHSFGAITSMILVGAELNGQSMVDYCATRGGWLCSLVEDVDPALLSAEIEPDERAHWPVAMSPGLWYAFGSQGEGLAPVDEILMLGGTLDDIFDHDEHIHPTYGYASGPKALGTLEGAGHFAFSDVCEVAYLFLPECDTEGEGYIEIGQAHAITQVLVTAWARLHIAGDEGAAPWLEADARAVFPELSWEEEP
jgi:predicted dienelactone hydrolase